MEDGLIQGDPISMILMNVVVVVWMRMVRKGVALTDAEVRETGMALGDDAEARQQIARPARPGVRLGGLVDDIHAAARGPHARQEVKRIHWITIFWTWGLGMVINTDKSKTFGGMNIAGMQDKMTADLLGESLRMHREAKVPRPDKQWGEVTKRLVRLGRVPGGRERRLRLAGQSVLAVLYGDQYEDDVQDIRRVRKEVWKTVRGREPPTDACYEVLYTVHAKGHREDVAQKMDCDAIMAYARFAELADAETREDMRMLWDRVKRPRHVWKTRGPIAVLHGRMHGLGDVLGGPGASRGHRLREALRQRETRKVVNGNRFSGQPRESYAGLGARGIDAEATRKPVKHLDPLEHGTLIRIQSGTVVTRVRAWDQKRTGHAQVQSNRCECGEREDYEHRYHRCRLTEELRPAWYRNLDLNGVPRCLVNHCVMPVDYHGPVRKRFVDFAKVYVAIDNAVQERRVTVDEAQNAPRPAEAQRYQRRTEANGGHPAAAVVNTDDGGKHCTRCGSTYKGSKSLNAFWAGRCVAFADKTAERQTRASISRKTMETKHADTRKRIFEAVQRMHGGTAAQMRYNDYGWGSIYCVACSWGRAWNDFAMELADGKPKPRSQKVAGQALHVEVCRGGLARTERRKKAETIVAEYAGRTRAPMQRATMHKLAARDGVVMCTVCGEWAYNVQAARGLPKQWKDNCDTVASVRQAKEIMAAKTVEKWNTAEMWQLRLGLPL